MSHVAKQPLAVRSNDIRVFTELLITPCVWLIYSIFWFHFFSKIITLEEVKYFLCRSHVCCIIVIVYLIGLVKKHVCCLKYFLCMHINTLANTQGY